MFQPRFANGAYRDCRFCRGRGCLGCASEADKEYGRQFPNGPKPIATFKMDDPEDAEKAKALIGPDAITEHFGQDGAGMTGLIEALRKAGKLGL